MYRVLVVDDEPAVFEDLNLMVRWSDLGFSEADTATDGEEALGKMEKENYDLIITDIRMPGMSGLELLKTLHEKSSRTKMLVLSGYGEFHYATEAIQYGVKGYLLKPMDKTEFTGMLQKIKAELDSEYKNRADKMKRQALAKDRFLYDLVSGILPEAEILSGAAEFGFEAGQYPYMVALCEIDGFYNMLASNVEEARNAGKALRILAEKTMSRLCRCDFYGDADGLMGIVIHAKEALSQARVESLLSRLCDSAVKELKIHLHIGYGNFGEGLRSLSLSRKNALHALERRFITADSRVVSYAQVEFNDDSLWHLNWDSRQLLDAVETGDFVLIRSRVEEFAAKLSEEYFPREMITNLIFELCTIIRQSGGAPEQIFHYSDIRSFLEKFSNVDELTEWLAVLCQRTVGYRNSFVSDEKNSRIVDQVRKYLDENYCADTTIKELSQMFFINSGYLGQLFKKRVGDNIKDYVNKKRISEVKKLSTAGNLPVGTIIKKAGYRNPGYFYKKFRDYEGISFAEYNSKRKKPG